jgi:hypothetical protein
MRALLLACVLVCVGCAGSVSGEVDDESVPALISGFFIQLDEAENAFGVSATLVSVPDGCNQATERQKNFNDAFEKQKDALKDANEIEDADARQDAIDAANDDFANAIVTYDEDNAPTDYWTVGVTVNVEDDGDVEDKYDVEDDAAKAGLSVCRVNDHPRNKNGAVRLDQDCFVATSGDLEITTYEKDETFAFTADVKLKDALNLDKQKGDVTITGSTTYCEDLESAVDDFADLQAD